MHKPGKAIISVGKKQERKITFVTIISTNALQIKWILGLKKQKNISETSYLKMISINVCRFFNFLFHVTTFWDLSTWKCVISKYPYMYVKLSSIPAQEVPFLEFHIPNFVHILYIIKYTCVYIYINIYHST